MTRQSFLGILFVLIGLGLLVIICAPVVVAIEAHQALPDLKYSLVLVGLGVTVFGAWLIPSSGVGATTVNILSVAGPLLPSFGRRGNSGEQPKP